MHSCWWNLKNIDNTRETQIKSGDSSNQSWVEIPGDGMRDGRDGDGVDGQCSNTPRNGVSFVKVVRYTRMAPGFLTVPLLQKILQSHRNVLQIYQFHLFQLL